MDKEISNNMARFALNRAILMMEPPNQAELARRSGYGRAYICRLTKSGDIPAETCVKLEQATGGKIHRSEFNRALFIG